MLNSTRLSLLSSFLRFPRIRLLNSITLSILTPSDSNYFSVLYNLSQEYFTIQNKYFITDVCKCMHAMYDMHDPNGSPVK